MAFDPVNVANSILQCAWKNNIKDITPMKLQKLLFIAHAYYLKMHKKPLIDGDFYKWKFGPVEKSVYREFSGFGANSINKLATDALGYSYVIPDDQKDAWEMVRAVINVFGRYDPWRLSELSHLQGTAWDLSKDDEPILNELIQSSPIYRD